MKRFAICLYVITALLIANSAGAQLSVLVDSSRDGGVWWFPQSQNFDSALPHQGKAFADFLRTQGMRVIELPRPFAITSELLRSFDLVIAANECNSYSAAELAAYDSYAVGGGRLILLSGPKGNPQCDTDSLPQRFGIDFSGVIGGTITDFTPHPITKLVSSLSVFGSFVMTAPADSTFLGRLSGTPVMGIVRGQVFFMGDFNAIQLVSQPFVRNLLTYFLSVRTLAKRVDALAMRLDAQQMLVSVLVQADRGLLAGNTQEAIRSLEAFVLEVFNFQKLGLLDPLTASTLILDAEAIIGFLT